MNIKELNNKIYEINTQLEDIENEAVKKRVVEMTLNPLKKQLEVKILKRQSIAKSLPISEETDKLLMAI